MMANYCGTSAGATDDSHIGLRLPVYGGDRSSGTRSSGAAIPGELIRDAPVETFHWRGVDMPRASDATLRTDCRKKGGDDTDTSKSSSADKWPPRTEWMQRC
jgi:hypothetical protein